MQFLSLLDSGAWKEHVCWSINDLLRWPLFLTLLTTLQPCNKRSIAHSRTRRSQAHCLHRFLLHSPLLLLIAIALNVTFLYRPVIDSPRSSFKGYLHDWNGRGWALLAGLVCGFGNGLQFMGGQAAGYAAADAVQYRRSSPRTYALLVGMLAMFAVAVGLLMASAGKRDAVTFESFIDMSK
ncbi:hypothetical protein Bca52824_063884 [Brassica carinata]|uniref:Uncharacterized protein n=1 Tax=Brassica carinata TaxID=52824 RepID=A0A8X7QF77_BRACI|nr:hypothetical protein Bca52824_063884 [Brassica carinata]